jgi:hypothetical protein
MQKEPFDEDVEEFGEDEEVKRNTKAIVSGAKTGMNYYYFYTLFNLTYVR